MKKRLIALILFSALLFTMLFSLISCGKDYEPVESTAEEKRTVMKISYDGEKYEVPYELYRAFFLQFKSEIDGGNSEVWTSENKDDYIKAADELIYRRISEIYAIFHLCEKADIDVYSKEFNDTIEEHVKVSVEGGTVNDTVYEGFGGDYDAYLASLKEMNLNYSVQALLIRYQLAYETLLNYYVGGFANDTIDENSKPGEIDFTKEDVKEFYFDEDESRTVLMAQLNDAYFTEARANEIRNSIASKQNATEVRNYIAGFTLSNPVGEVIGKYTYDEFYYRDLTESVFSLDVGETGAVVTLRTDIFDGYVIAYRLDVSEEYFNENYDDIALSYLYNEFGEIVESAKAKIAEAISPTDTLKKLDRSLVSMD